MPLCAHEEKGVQEANDTLVLSKKGKPLNSKGLRDTGVPRTQFENC
jgi:hypothetical protein